MTDVPEDERPITEVRQREDDFGQRYREVLEPYRTLGDGLVDVASDLFADIPEKDPDAELAVALIAARIATESLAVHHLLGLGYPVQAFTIVGTMLELMHTAAYIGGDNERAHEYFAHADKARAYPGSVKSTIEAVGSTFGIPQEAVDREYKTFYNQMCLVKHGNPMAMSLGTMTDEESLYLFVGPVFTAESVRLAFATAQQAVRYLLLVLNVFVRYHRSGEDSRAFFERIKVASTRWEFLNSRASDALAAFETPSADSGR